MLGGGSKLIRVTDIRPPPFFVSYHERQKCAPTYVTRFTRKKYVVYFWLKVRAFKKGDCNKRGGELGRPDVWSKFARSESWRHPWVSTLLVDLVVLATPNNFATLVCLSPTLVQTVN